MISSYGSLISVFSTIIFLYILYDQLTKIENPVSSDYWYHPQFFNTSNIGSISTLSSDSLEWTISTPTPLHYLYELPKVTDTVDNSPITNTSKSLSILDSLKLDSATKVMAGIDKLNEREGSFYGLEQWPKL
ncbi:hypothetical protein BB561_006840 [Smittium simulii]|uniref:Cytochrome oxidase subunit I profile domain-containing protein n=1 Tax=Smittium simulii TaxID=133385 RepID=A0A2T9Y0X0_9FUNG|nr:hypothetical protein BB561_006840 [Smittium simulii]